MTTAQRIIKYFALGLAALIVISIISGVVSLAASISGILDGRETPDEELKYTESFYNAKITSLDIKLGVTNLIVKAGEFAVKTNNSYITWTLEGETLKIKEKDRNKLLGVDGAYTLELYVPAGTVFNDVEIEAGVGEISMGELSCKILSLELGTGRVELEKLIVSEIADVDGGVGEFTVKSGEVNDLEFVMGVGKADITLAIGNGKIDGGVGSMSVTLLGKKEDYKLTLTKGLGDISVDGESVSNNATLGDGASRLTVTGGVGSIAIGFE